MKRLKEFFKSDAFQQLKDDNLEALVIVATVLGLVLIANVFSACRSTKTTTTDYQVRTDTVCVYLTQRDSITLHDSIYESIIQRGETIYSTKTVYRDKFRDRIKHDSIYIDRTDTIYQDNTITIEKGQTIYQRILQWIGSLAIIVAIAFAAWFEIYWRKK